MTPKIPESSLNKHIAILGMNGSGKTSVAKAEIIEPALAAGMRVCNIDPTGVGWGLRLKANGTGKGFNIYIVGGSHADFPLHRRDGKAWAEIVGTTGDSFIFDTKMMTVTDRSLWFTDFAETLLIKNKGALRLVIDEMHLFAPKQTAQHGGVAPSMLAATNNLISLGRSGGIRATMISQRPAKLHNDSLTQAHTLIAMQLTSPHDRRAVMDWIEDQADAEQGKKIVASLPTLDPGHGWIWAPREKVLECVRFSRPRTFDSSSAPDDNSGDGPALPSIDPAAITARLETVAKETVATDPRRLQARIAELERQAASASADPQAIEKARAEGFEAGLKHTRARIVDISAAVSNTLATFDAMATRMRQFDAALQHLADPPARTPHPPASPKPPPPRRDRSDPEGGIPGRYETIRDGANIPKGERAVLTGIAMHSDGVTREHLTVLTGYKRSSRDAYLQRLEGRGYIEAANGRIVATPAGIAALGGNYRQLPTGAELRELMLQKLPEGEAKVLTCAIEAHPRSVPREEIEIKTGYKRSSRDAYIQRLSTRELITAERGSIRASDHLFNPMAL